MSDLSDLRAVQRAAFRDWFLQTQPTGVFDAISLAAQYRRATGDPIDWHETASVLEQFALDDDLVECGRTRSGLIKYILA